MHDYEKAMYIDNGKIIDLSDRENELLNILIENKHKYVKFKEISEKIYKLKLDKAVKFAIRTAICRLKNKTNINIKSKFNYGYMID